MEESPNQGQWYTNSEYQIRTIKSHESQEGDRYSQLMSNGEDKASSTMHAHLQVEQNYEWHYLSPYF